MKTTLLFLTAATLFLFLNARAQSAEGLLTAAGRMTIDPIAPDDGGAENPGALFKPVDLVVTSMGGSVDLSWIMPGVSAASSFRVERSTDGQQWDFLATISAIESVQPQEVYLFSDDAPYFGTSYYRLTAITIDGDAIPLDLEVAHRKAPAALLYPNPAKDHCQLILTNTTGATTMEIEVYNLQGNRLLTQSLQLTNGVNTVSLNTNLLSPGQYVIRSFSGGIDSMEPMRLTICN